MEELDSDLQGLAGDEIYVKREITLKRTQEQHLEQTLTPVRGREGAITGWLMVFRDVTEERELARLREELTHMLIHDLRSPLTAVKGGLDMMAMGIAENRTDGFDKLISLAQRGSGRMLGMINELLDISKLESGQMVVGAESVQVEPLLEDAVSRLTTLIAHARINVVVEVEPDLPLLFVDPVMIGRVLNNLLDNAIKFTPDGGEIRLWARSFPGTVTENILVGVTDTGPGIPLHERPRLFEKFQQVGQGRRAGTGLGLPFCKLTVEAHGGRIWVESEEGQGSTFMMILPTTP
jgi:signal transduction histidine kinase